MIKGNSYETYFKKYEPSPLDSIPESLTVFTEETPKFTLTGDECKRSQMILSNDEKYSDDYIRLVAKEEASEFYMVFMQYMTAKIKPSFILNAVTNPVYMEVIIDSLDSVIDDGYHVLCKITRDFILNKEVITKHLGAETSNKLESLYVSWFIDKNITYITSIADTLNVNRDMAVNLTLQCPQLSKSSPADNIIVRGYAKNFLNYIYSLAQDSIELDVNQRLDAVDFLRTIYTSFFKIRMDQFLLAVFLEDRTKTSTMTDPQKSVWATTTLIALDILESWSIETIRKFIHYYVSLKYGTDYPSRISLLNGIAQEDYKSILKVCDELVAEYPQYKNIL